MTRRSAGRTAAVFLVGCALALGGFLPLSANAGDAPPLASIRAPENGALIRRPDGSRVASGTSRGGPWWLGSAGVVAIFAGLGYAVWSARRGTFRLGSRPKGLDVLGRTALTPKHHVHLLRAGDRILIIGTGPGGSPAFLGEWTGPDPTAPTAPARLPRDAGGGA